MALRYNIDFETGNYSQWETDSSGSPNMVVATPGLNGSTYLSQTTYDTSLSTKFVRNNMGLLSSLGTIWRWGCRAKVQTVLYNASVVIYQFIDMGALGRIGVVDGGGGTYDVQNNGGSSTLTANVGIADQTEFTVEIRVQQESSMGAGDGQLSIYVDGVVQASSTTETNFAIFNNQKTGFFQHYAQNIFGFTNPTGGVDVDNVVFRDDDTQIFPPPSTSSVLWLRNNSGIYTSIGDPAWASAHGAITVPGASLQEFWAAVGATIRRTTNGGSSWSTFATLTFNIGDLWPYGTGLIAVSRDTGAGNKVAIIDQSAVITYINTGHSITGVGNTIRAVG